MDSPSQSNTLADLTACVRRTNGVRPPPLVGCSITLIGDSVYLFGGRLVPTRTMVSTLYSLNLNTLAWTNLTPPTSSLSPSPRYFHSAEAWGNKIIIFGGEGYATSSANSQGLQVIGTTVDPTASPLCTLGDLWIWDTIKGEWENPEPACIEGVEKPEGRYAHLSIVNSSYSDQRRGTGGLFGGEVEKESSTLTIIGGQDLANTYLHSVNVLDLDEMKWVRVGKWDNHIGTYRAVVATSKFTIGKSSVKADGKKPEGGQEALNQISYSKKPTVEDPTPLFIFSNFNFTQVRRDLDLLSAPIAPFYSLEATSLSAHMTGLSLPPGLRFPTGTIIGHHLLIFGTYLSAQEDNFSIWALDLGKGGGNVLERIEQGGELEWMRVDPGICLSKGSWNRAVCWNNTVVVLGDRERSIATDYNHRQTNFVHVAFVDLEAFAIYQPPMEPMSAPAQSFGLLSLAQPSLADFEIISSDGSRIGCSRRVLEVRWNWFKELVISRGEVVRRGSNSSDESLTVGTSPQLDSIPTPILSSNSIRTPNSSQYSSRTLYLPESSLTIQAFLQYLYTHTLCTSLQLSLPILTSLLLFSKIYEEPNLTALVVHALHETLSLKEGGLAAATVYNVAGVAGCTALQIRALRLMMSNSRVTKKSLNVSPNQTSPDPTLDEGDDSSRRLNPPPSSTRSPPPLRGLRSNLRPSSRHGENSIQSIPTETDRVLNYKPIMIPASPTNLTQPIPLLTISPHPRPREPLPHLPHLPHLPRSSSKPEIAEEDVHSAPLPILIPASRSNSISSNLDDLALEASSSEVAGNSPVEIIQNSPRVLRRSNSNGKKAAIEEFTTSKSIPRALPVVEERQPGEFGSMMSTIPEGQKLKSHSGLGLSDMGYDVRMLVSDGEFNNEGDAVSPERPISNSSVYSPSVSPRQLFPSHTIGFDSRRYLRRHESSRGTSVTSGKMSSISSTEAGTDRGTRQSSFSSLESSPRSPDLSPVKESSPIQSIPLTTIKSLPQPPPTPIIASPTLTPLSVSNSSIKSSKKSKFSFLKSKAKGPSRPKMLDADRPIIKFDSRSPTGMVIIRPPTVPVSPTLLQSSSISVNSKSTSSSEPSSTSATAFFPPRDTIDTARLPTPALMYLNPRGAQSQKSLHSNIFSRSKSRVDTPFEMPTFGGY